MRFLNLTLLPTGEALDEQIVDTAELDALRFALYCRLFASDALATGIDVPGVSGLRVQCTASREGMALGTFWVGENVLFSTVMLAGRTPAPEAEVLDMFYQSVSRAGVVAELASDETPFATFYVKEERPASFGVLWPVLPREQLASFAGCDIYLAAAFFTVIGVERAA
jgi:hypothetical protein